MPTAPRRLRCCCSVQVRRSPTRSSSSCKRHGGGMKLKGSTTKPFAQAEASRCIPGGAQPRCLQLVHPVEYAVTGKNQVQHTTVVVTCAVVNLLNFPHRCRVWDPVGVCSVFFSLRYCYSCLHCFQSQVLRPVQQGKGTSSHLRSYIMRLQYLVAMKASTGHWSCTTPKVKVGQTSCLKYRVKVPLTPKHEFPRPPAMYAPACTGSSSKSNLYLR
jgi:hypothetical protein